MRFLIVYPPLDAYTNYWHPHLGLGYISAVLSNNGHDTEVVDAVANKWGLEDLDKHFSNRHDYDSVLITATTSEIASAHDVASIVKKYNNALVVVGGSHTTALPA